MDIAVIGVNHHQASIAVREAVSFTDKQKLQLMNELLDFGVEEVVILSTCNRSEIYLRADGITEKLAYLKEFYSGFSGISKIDAYLFLKLNEEAMTHLFRVAAGLDSLVLGEDQILGQVKEAHEFSLNMGGSKKVFNRLFQQAVVTAKEIKAKTKMSEHPLSISYIAIKFLKKKLGSFNQKKILLIGAGTMSRLALTYLSQEEGTTIYLTNRNHEKSLALQGQFSQVIAIPYEERYGYFTHVDVVISATAAPHLIIKEEHVPVLGKNVVVMDLALPRDIDSSLKERQHIFLYDIDVLREIQHDHTQKRLDGAQVANHLIEEGVATFCKWQELTHLDSTIQSLNERCLEIQQESLNYLFRKIELPVKEQQLVEWVLISALKRLTREPIVHLKQVSDREKREAYLQLIEELFNIEKGL